MSELERYRFHWRDGTTTDATGMTPADALTRLGLPAESIPALDHFERLTPHGALATEAPQG